MPGRRDEENESEDAGDENLQENSNREIEFTKIKI